MAVFNKVHIFVENLAEKVHNLGSDTLKIALSNTAVLNTNAVYADITPISPGNGYTAGGATLNVTGSVQTAGVYKLTVDDVVFTASGGTIGPFRYVVMYNDTPTSPAKPLIGWYDYGSSITLNPGETLTVDFDQTNGVLTIT